MKNLDHRVFQQFIGNISQFLWWKDLNSVFLGCNENVAKYFNLKSTEDIVGMTDFDLYESKKDAESVRKIDQEVISSGKPQLNFEECLLMPTQGQRWLSTSKVPLYDLENNIIGTIGWFNDITDIKEMQVKLDKKSKAILEYSFELEKTNKTLALANSELERFAFVAAHELQAPIRTVKGFTSLLGKNERDNLSEESQGYIDLVCDSAERMEALIDGILTYARVGSRQLSTENVNVHELVSDKIKDLRFIIQERGAQIKLNLPTKEIKAYKSLIGLVFYNLISNGLKYNDEPVPSITCDYTEESEFWIFSVTDNGIGIAAKNKEVIFEPYKRLDSNSKKGSGIGLSTCHKVVVLHHGDIWLEKSTKGHTVFKFSIAKKL